ncbi:hypothetical protein FRC07_008482 [Ceratobasidium sp. 392]|nr:hypothetical protein FRC07_008482 [Ceratobasidium sp. 392]
MTQDEIRSVAHPTHFHGTGDVLLEAQTTLFRVHKAILCQHSEVFNDMFDLPGIGDCELPIPDVSNRIIIQDEPVVFELLLDVVYQDAEISYMTPKQQLQLALLAHKYEMRSIQIACQACIASRLPKAISTRDFSQASSYEDDTSTAPLVVRVGQLLQMPDLLPWAMYHFAIQSDASDSLLAEDDILLRHSYSRELEAVRAINKRAIKGWNRSVARFMNEYCLAEWWVNEDECWRRTELLDLDESSFALGEDTTDSLRAMNDAVDSWSPELCSLCADELMKHANRVMAGILERISQGVLQTITPALAAERALRNSRVRWEVIGGRKVLIYSR